MLKFISTLRFLLQIYTFNSKIIWDFIILIQMLDQTYSQEFEVEQIVDEKMIDDETHYLVKWVGYGHEENTWEPLRHMTNSKEKIKQWEKFKQKQLSLLQNFETLDRLNLGPQKNKNTTRLDSGLIEGISKSSSPYRNFKPIVLLNPIEKSDDPENEQKGKTVSLFDRPEVKKIIKRRKIERKKKQLEIFEQRIKSRPRVWEKYLQNEEQAIKEANQKIKEVVDQVFGSKGGNTQNQQQKTVIVQENQQKSSAIQRKECFEGKDKLIIMEKKPEDKFENMTPKKRLKPLEIFSDSDQETSYLKRPMKNEYPFQKITSVKDKLQDSSESINESTNFMTNREFPKKKTPNKQEDKQCQKVGENLNQQIKKPTQMMAKKSNLPIVANMFIPQTPKPSKEPIKEEEDVPKALRTNKSSKTFFIQPETIRLTDNFLKMVSQKPSEKISTEESSSSSEFHDGCRLYKEQNESSSSSSSSSFYGQGGNQKILGFAQRTIMTTGKQNEIKSRQNNSTNQNKAQKFELTNQNISNQVNQFSSFGMNQRQTQGKELQINFDDFINISESFDGNKAAKIRSVGSEIKVEELKKTLSEESNDIKQENKSLDSSDKSSVQKFSKKVKLEWSFPIKLSQDNIQEFKLETEAKVQSQLKKPNTNFENKQNDFTPFPCSISTIEGLQTSDEGFEESQPFVLQNASNTANLLLGQSVAYKSQKVENLDSSNGQRIINYSSLTNHQSTALPSQVSGQGFHIFTNENAFNLDQLRNHSLSTRASLNTHRTQVQSHESQRNSHGRSGENDVLNQGNYQSTPDNIFSSSSDILNRSNLTNVLKKSKMNDSNMSLSLEQILELLNKKSSKLSNEKLPKDSNTQLYHLSVKKIDFIELDNDDPSIQISSNTAKSSAFNGSEKSSQIVINYKDIGSQNKGKEIDKVRKERRHSKINEEKSKQKVNTEIKKIKQENDLSDFHCMLILENTMTEC